MAQNRIKYVLWPLRMCIMFAIPLPPISSEWTQWLLCITLEKLKDMNIFLAASIEEAQTQMACLLRAASTSCWRVSVIHQGVENNNANKGTEQVGFNGMLPSRQYILHVLCLGGSAHLNPYLTVCRIFTKNNQTQRKQIINIKHRKVTTASLSQLNTPPSLLHLLPRKET